METIVCNTSGGQIISAYVTYISYVGLHFFLCFGHLYFREFVLLLPSSYIFLLYNRTHTESGTSDEKHGSEYAFVGYQ